jgi:hypothetical protein
VTVVLKLRASGAHAAEYTVIIVCIAFSGTQAVAVIIHLNLGIVDCSLVEQSAARPLKFHSVTIMERITQIIYDDLGLREATARSE